MHEIPIFRSFNISDCVAWPGYLPERDAATLESIHKWLRAAVSNAPDHHEKFICEAVQKVFDMLKEIHESNGSLNLHVLVEVLPQKTFGLILDCGWLPEWARTERWKWREWVDKLVAGRFSQTAFGDSCSVDPYMFVHFPLQNLGDEGVPTAQMPAGVETVTHRDRDRVRKVDAERLGSPATGQYGEDGHIGRHKTREIVCSDTTWNEVEVIVSDEQLRIVVCGKAREVSFCEAGFGKRDQKLEVLSYFAASRGTLQAETFSLPNQPKTPLKSLVSRLRTFLRNLFGIDGNPIEHHKKAGMYKCGFQIRTFRDKTFPTPNGATWLDFSFHMQRDGRLRVSVAARHSFRSLDTTRSAQDTVKDLPQPESDVSNVYSFEDLGLRTSAGGLTRSGRTFAALLRGGGRLEAKGDDMAILKLAETLRTWTGLDGDPLQSRSKGGIAGCRTGLETVSERRSYSAGETEDERGRKTSDYCWDKEALGCDQGGEGCCCGSGTGCGDAQDSARQSSSASQERRPHPSGTKGPVHRNEETMGGEKEGGGEGQVS